MSTEISLAEPLPTIHPATLTYADREALIDLVRRVLGWVGAQRGEVMATNH